MTTLFLCMVSHLSSHLQPVTMRRLFVNEIEHLTTKDYLYDEATPEAA